MKLENLTIVLIMALPLCVTAQDNPIDIDDFFENRGMSETAQGTIIQESGLNVKDDPISVPRFFEVPQDGNPDLGLAMRQQLLDKTNSLAKVLREIKEEGNEEAVLTLLESFSNSPDTVAFFEEAFSKLKVANNNVVSNPVNIQVTPSPVAQTPAAPVRRVIHQIIPVFAQVDTEGGANKAIVAIDGKRYVRIPGETIQHENRSILLESISSGMENGREIYTIWVVENGSRNSLVWN